MSITTPTTPLDIDRGRFAAVLGERPITFRHGVVDHPLLALDAIAGWADEWPARWTEHHLADLPLLLPRGNPAKRLDASPGDVVRGLESNNCWMVLWFVETLPAYQRLLDEVLDRVVDVVREREGTMGRRGANLFFGSPGSVAPAHFDRHHNLLLQVRGTKDVSIGVFDDPAQAQREIESHFGVQHNLHDLPEQQETFHLEPGDGLYIPPYAFHWVVGGPEASLSLSCGFETPTSTRDGLVHTCNVHLRRLGLNPAPPGASMQRDRAKAALVQTRRRLEPLRAKATQTLRARLGR